MSWSIFKKELQVKMLNPNWNDVSDFADFFTKKYDECMKRGLDNITQNTVVKGNTDLMRSAIIIALRTGNISTTESFYTKSVGLLGKGAVAYWTGAELSKNPPIIPAPGTVLNLSVVSNTVTNPGVWPTNPLPILPNISSDPFIDGFILLGSIHLQSISGICNTISQYPPPASPGPAVLLWTGFTVDVSVASQPSVSNPITGANELSPADKGALLRKRIEEINNELFVNPSPALNEELNRIQQELQKLGLEKRVESAKFNEFNPFEMQEAPAPPSTSGQKTNLPKPVSNSNLNKGWEGKQVPQRRTKINPAIEGPKLKKLYGAEIAKCMLANMAIEQPNGGFNNNMGGFDITSGGWSFDSKSNDGYFVTTEGTTKKLKAFASFKSLDAFYEKTVGSFKRKGANSIRNADQFEEFYYQKWWGGDGTPQSHFKNDFGISIAKGGKYRTWQEYAAASRARFKQAYQQMAQYVK